MTWHLVSLCACNVVPVPVPVRSSVHGQVWTAPSAVGPYTYYGDVARIVNGSNTTNGPDRGYSPTRAQQFGIAVVGGQVLYQGVRWHHAPAPFCYSNPPVWSVVQSVQAPLSTAPLIVHDLLGGGGHT